MTVENTKVSFFDRPNIEKGMIDVGQEIPFGIESVSNPAIGIGDVLQSHIHVTPRLKSVEVKVVEHLVQGVGRVVGVHQLLFSGIFKGFNVHVYVHVIVYLLLPVAIVGLGGYPKGC